MKIRIKKKNIGKFNATKKRTGKTTEKLTHSKNPLTRKRAIFAQNARKWKHQEGGNLFQYGTDDLKTRLLKPLPDKFGYNEQEPNNTYIDQRDYELDKQIQEENEQRMWNDINQHILESSELLMDKNGNLVVNPLSEKGLKQDKLTFVAETLPAMIVSGAVHGVLGLFGNAGMSNIGQKVYKGLNAIIPGTQEFYSMPLWKQYATGMLYTSDALNRTKEALENPTWGNIGEAALVNLPFIQGVKNVSKINADEAKEFFNTLKSGVDKTGRFLSSSKTGKWTQFGNREYRFSPNYLGMNGVPVESRPLQISSEGIKPQIKPLVRGAEIEKQLSKQGTISRNQLDAYIKKQAQVYQEIMNKVLNEEFDGVNKIDYSAFRNAVQKKLPEYNRIPQTHFANYGMDRIGFQLDGDVVNAEPLNDEFGGQWVEFEDIIPDYTLNTFTFESPGIIGNTKHYKGNPIGHSRTYATKDEPDILHVMESQSDWAQGYEAPRLSEKGFETHYDRIERLNREILDNEEKLKKGIAPDGHKLEYDHEIQQVKDIIQRDKDRLKELQSTLDKINNPNLYKNMTENYQSRQIQENLRYAAEQGQTKMRYPTRETTAKIEQYPETRQFDRNEYTDVVNNYNDQIKKLKDKYNLPHDSPLTIEELDNNFDPNEFLIDGEDPIAVYKELVEKIKSINKKDYEGFLEESSKLQTPEQWMDERPMGYNPQYETILKKYDSFPKQFQKLFGKKAEVRTVTDSKGNTWYEVDVPESYKNGTAEIIFKDGGYLNFGNKFKNGGYLDYMVWDQEGYRKYRMDDQPIMGILGDNGITTISTYGMKDKEPLFIQTEYESGVMNPNERRTFVGNYAIERPVRKMQFGGITGVQKFQYYNPTLGFSMPKNVFDNSTAVQKYMEEMGRFQKSYDENPTIEIKPIARADKDLRNRQLYIESKGDKNAVSHAGAQGLFQIMPKTKVWYADKTGNNGDVFDPVYNGQIRDWYMDWIHERPLIKNDKIDITDRERMAYASYNCGYYTVQKAYQKYGEDWINHIPKESREYAQFIVDGKTTSGGMSMETYNKWYDDGNEYIMQYGGVAKPFSYYDIPDVRYSRGGHLFRDGGKEEELYSAGMLPEATVVSSRIYPKEFEYEYNPHKSYNGYRDKYQAYKAWQLNQPVMQDMKERISSIPEVFKRAIGVGKYAIDYAKHKLGIHPPTFINLNNENVNRITSNTDNVKDILFNDFVERNNNSYRKKRDFVNTEDTLIGDRHIPLSNITTFYGVENGKLKAGPIDIFKESTIIAPNRSNYVGKIKEVLPYENKLQHRTRKERKEFSEESRKLFVQRYGYEYPRNPSKEERIRYSLIRFPEEEVEKVIETGIYPRPTYPGVNLKGITTNNDTIELNINATPKTAFADEYGNAFFVSGLNNPDILEKINSYLSQTPMYPIMVDNGRFSQYTTKGSPIKSYSGFSNPDNMFIIGTTKYKNGGHLFAKGGPEDKEEVPPYNRALYNTVNPVWGYPGFWEAVRLRREAKNKVRNGTQDVKEYETGNDIGSLVSDAAFKKRLGLDYNQLYLPQFNGDTVRLPESVEREIPIDTTILKDRIKTNKSLLKKYSPGTKRYTVVKNATENDKKHLEALRKTYKTGEPVGVNEFSWNSRQLISGGQPVDLNTVISPLNVLHNYNIRYDAPTNRMYYSDQYDFNQYEPFVPGEPFRIRGYIDLNKK